MPLWASRLLAALALAFTGCSASGPRSGAACVTNRDCPLTEICLSAVCTPVPAKKCDGDASCKSDEFCDADGACKPRQTVLCSSDDACPASQRCNTTTGVCINGARSCSGEAQCTAIGKHCNLMLNQCVDCVDATQCPNGQTCSGNTCVDPNMTGTCSGDFACGPPARICDGGQCTPGCTPTSCAQGSMCNTSTGRCTMVQATCTQDNQCGAPNRVCESTQCVPGCAQVGGLSCSGGDVCDPSTGRCVRQQGSCQTDPQCGPPARVCESSQCVPGCGQTGGVQCSGGQVCDTSTGRCVMMQGPCTTDPQCGAPTQVCEGGQCVPGCAEIGGVQCSGTTSCNPASGRCETMGMMGCTTDPQCGAPSNICENMRCVPGCLSAGCGSGFTCDPGTGRCSPTMGMGGGSPLDAACTTNTDCASRTCFDLGSGIGRRCISSCGRSADCPTGFTCYDFTGAKMCLSSGLFGGGATFSRPVGQSCAVGGECVSNYCDQNQNRCIETCTDNGDCGGSGCRFAEIASSIFSSTCQGALGPGPTGAACGALAECQSGICAGSACRASCSSVADCGAGEICELLDASVCLLDVGFCIQWQPNFVRACIPAPSGAGAVGAPCSNPNACRSGICQTVLGQCVDHCARDTDCPGGFRCKVDQYGQLSDGTTVYLNVCLPEGF